jgi:hypothetical protein
VLSFSWGNYTFLKGLNKYKPKSKKYINTAKPTTTNKFGPSGSSIKKKKVRERIRDTMPKIIRADFFDLKYLTINLFD